MNVRSWASASGRAPGIFGLIAVAFGAGLLWLLAALPTSAMVVCHVGDYFRPGDSVQAAAAAGCTAFSYFRPGDVVSSSTSTACTVSKYFRPGDVSTSAGRSCGSPVTAVRGQPAQQATSPVCTVSSFFRPGDSVPPALGSSCATMVNSQEGTQQVRVAVVK